MKIIGNLSGAAGVLMIAVGVVGRFKGQAQVFGWEAITFVIMGIALLSIGCFALLQEK